MLSDFKSILLLSLLFTLFFVSGCEKKGETIYPTDNLPEQVTLFFENSLPIVTESPCFFKSTNEDIVYVVNSNKELQALYSCKEVLPEIDFSQYSIIIGQKRMPNSFYFVADQKIVVSSRAFELNVVAKTLSEGVWPAFSTMYYWGVYPKLPNKVVNVNVIIK